MSIVKPLARLRHALRGNPTQAARIATRELRRTDVPRRGYLAAVAMFQDEAPYLAEWIAFHRMLGFEHFYLYDHASSDDSRAIIAPYIASGVATYIPWGVPWLLGATTAQTVAYVHAIGSFGEDWRWMAFIDVDEFLFPTAGDSMADFLRNYEDVPALLAFWTMFGFSGHDSIPKGCVTDNYIMRAPFGFHAKPKSIVNPAEVVAVSNAHLFDLTRGPRQGFTENRELFAKVDGLVGRRNVGFPVSDKLRLNHYYTKSRQDFADKIRKRHGSSRAREVRKLNRIAEELEASAFADDAIRRFVPRLKEHLASGVV